MRYMTARTMPTLHADDFCAKVAHKCPNWHYKGREVSDAELLCASEPFGKDSPDPADQRYWLLSWPMEAQQPSGNFRISVDGSLSVA